MPGDDKQHYYQEDVLGTLYPYVNIKQGSINQSISGLRRALVNINPFALQ